MKGTRFLVLAAAALATACSTQAPPTGTLKGRLDKVYADDYGEWLQHESAADRNLDTAHMAMHHMERDYYWNITEMQDRADAAAATALDERQKAEAVYKRIVDKRLHHLESMHVSEADAVMEAEAIALFRTGSASPSKLDRAAVREIVATLTRYPVGFAEVRGYTDTVGNAKANDRLSARRVATVVGILRAAGAQRVSGHVVGLPMGEAGGPPNTPDQANRRVDVLVFPHGKGPK
jgi:outer membrane protein OmpA-like peptidoglycan-associated protein